MKKSKNVKNENDLIQILQKKRSNDNRLKRKRRRRDKKRIKKEENETFAVKIVKKKFGENNCN